MMLESTCRFLFDSIGLRTYLLGNTLGKDLGHILENVIFLELKRRGYKIYIGKNNDNEIDFVCETNDDIILLNKLSILKLLNYIDNKTGEVQNEK